MMLMTKKRKFSPLPVRKTTADRPLPPKPRLCQKRACGKLATHQTSLFSLPLCTEHARSHVDCYRIPVAEDEAALLLIERRDMRTAAADERRHRLFSSPRSDDGTEGAYTVRTSRGYTHCKPTVFPVVHLRALSPSVLGPVRHLQPDLADGLTLERFSLTLDRFVDHRTGEVINLDALGSRIIVSSFYEALVRPTVDFAKLRSLHVDEHRSLVLVGPGARLIQCLVGASDLMRYFDDLDTPFGHEMVLFTLLALPVLDRTADTVYPWRVGWRRLFGVSFDRYYAPETNE